MYGIPEQTKESFQVTLRRTLELSPEHISLYGLILEEGTPFYKNRENLPLPSEDTECDMYYMAAKMLHDAGYNHYEISNYAKPGFTCRHNLKYWRDEEYIGVGLSAYSYFGGSRYGNTKNPDEYLSEDCVKYRQEEIIDSKNEAYEFVMLALRLKEGFSLAEYRERFGSDFCLGREEIIERMQKAGYVSISNGRLSLTESGFYVSNSVIGELI